MRTDLLVIGAGIAGLSCALEADGLRVLVVNDTAPATDVASAWAQGGIAAAVGADDAPALHAADTLAAGAGIADKRIVHEVTAQAPAAIALLTRLGVAFDRADDGTTARGLEAAHSRRRIVHAADHTGATVMRGLLDAVARCERISLLAGWTAIDLMQTAGGAVAGARLLGVRGERLTVHARAVVLACGGYGGLYARTTTPLAAIGAGLSLAHRAGATLSDLEFVQFHPTALACGGDPLPLVSEAVRGEGAVLVDERGERFVDELAARDVVARAIFAVEARGGRAFLDARAALGPRFDDHFPTIAARCRAAGIEPSRELIPVTPVAHYTIGGVATDSRGRTDVAGLWACGETAATGLHGANRLASNSLLEGAVFGVRVAQDVGASLPERRATHVVPSVADAGSYGSDLGAALAPIRTVMSADVGVARDAAGLRRAADVCAAIAGRASDPRVRDAATLAHAIAAAASARRESRGAHARRDFPAADARFAARSFLPALDAVAVRA